MFNQLFKFGVVAVVLGACGCGTVSSVKPTPAGSGASLSHYRRAIVRDFDETVSTKLPEGSKREEKAAAARIATARFVEKVAAAVKASGAFEEVTREGQGAADTLEITGTVTRAVEGSGATRLFIGMGAGNAYFDATIEVRDSLSRELLGTVIVDRNSWGGGGIYSMTQTMESFTDEAARKVAADLAVARRNGRFMAPKAE